MVNIDKSDDLTFPPRNVCHFCSRKRNTRKPDQIFKCHPSNISVAGQTVQASQTQISMRDRGTNKGSHNNKVEGRILPIKNTQKFFSLSSACFNPLQDHHLSVCNLCYTNLKMNLLKENCQNISGFAHLIVTVKHFFPLTFYAVFLL